MAYVKGLRSIPFYSEEAVRLLSSPLLTVHSSENPSNPYGYGRVVSATSTSVSRACQDQLQCLTCGVSLVSRDDQVSHYKLDWHRFNLKRKAKGLSPIGEDEFENLGGDLSSISGSDSSEAEESLALSSVTEESDCESWSTSATSGSPLVTFSSGSSDQGLAVYRCVLTAGKCIDMENSNMLQLLRNLRTEQRWVVLMEAGGHFAGAVFKDHTVLVHKTFHRYTVRAKRGTVQSVRDNQGGHCKSAGASLRRYNEAALEQDIQELLCSWSDLLETCSIVFLRTSKYNRRIFVGGKGAMFEKGDPRLRTIPFATKRPTFNEVKRVHAMLAVVFEGDSLRGGSRKAEEGVCAKGGKEEEKGTLMEKRSERKLGDSGNCDSTLDKEQVKKNTGSEGLKQELEGGTGEENVQSQTAEKTKGKKRKKKVPSMKQESQTLEASCTEEAHMEEPAVLKEAPKTKESTQLTEPGTTDIIQELVQVCRAGDVHRLTSLFAEMGLVCAVDDEQGTGAETKSKVEGEETRETSQAGPKGDEDEETVGSTAPVDAAGAILKVVESSGQDGVSMEGCDGTRGKALLDTAYVGRTLLHVAAQHGSRGKALLDTAYEGRTLLHVAAQHGSSDLITTLLHYGADPTIKDATGKTPYMVAEQKGARDAFRRFVALYPGRWDLVAAKIPSPLTADMEQAKRDKAKAKKKAKKESDNKKRQQLEEVAVTQKQAVDNLSDREKRAMAAERRLALHVPSAPEVKRAGCCTYCRRSLAGLVPFEKFDFKYCSMDCLQHHRRQLSEREQNLKPKQ